MARIHRIGDPENDSESKAIRELAKRLPDNYFIFHNFELATDHGMPYEFDVAVVGEYAVYHVEVKGYRGLIRGDRHQWMFENGGVYPSPVPLANKKTKILASHLRRRSAMLESVFVETVVLLTDDRARAQLKDEQAHRVVHLNEIGSRLTDPRAVPGSGQSIVPLQDYACEAILGSRPAKKATQIGLYNVLEKINQTESRTVYLAEHRYIKMRPKTILKVFHFDLYSSKEAQEHQIRAIFHDQEALRLLSGHPNIIQTGDFFPWEGNKFVLPTEYVEEGRPLEVLLDKHEDRQLTWSEKRKIIGQIARGLRHAHQGGVIHRDVRPLNVVVAPGPVSKLVNFDLARIEEASDLPDLKDRLDPRTVAPEVWLDPRSASPRSDVYSLGILFYEFVTGEPPYGHVNDILASKTVPLDEARLLKELGTPGSEDFMAHPKDAVAAIRKMCAFDPAQRYGDMKEIIDDLNLIGD